MICAEHLFFSYNKKTPYLLADLSFHAGKGCYISITGENGCGKSTFLKIVLGFLTPSRGSIEVRTKKIGYMPQQTHVPGYGFPVTTEELLESYRRLLRLKDPKETDRVLDLLSIQPLRRELLQNLSGGQKQKVFLARALMGSPSLLLLDEPTTGIDLKSQVHLYELLRRLAKEHAMTILSVEHNPRCALYSDSIFVMQDGQGRFLTPADYARQYVPSAGR